MHFKGHHTRVAVLIFLNKLFPDVISHNSSKKSLDLRFLVIEYRPG